MCDSIANMTEMNVESVRRRRRHCVLPAQSKARHGLGWQNEARHRFFRLFTPLCSSGSNPATFQLIPTYSSIFQHIYFPEMNHGPKAQKEAGANQNEVLCSALRRFPQANSRLCRIDFSARCKSTTCALQRSRAQSNKSVTIQQQGGRGQMRPFRPARFLNPRCGARVVCVAGKAITVALRRAPSPSKNGGSLLGELDGQGRAMLCVPIQPNRAESWQIVRNRSNQPPAWNRVNLTKRRSRKCLSHKAPKSPPKRAKVG